MTSLWTILQSRIRHNKVVLFNIDFGTEGSEAISLFIVERRKGQIDISQRWESSEVDQVLPSKLISSGLPVYVQVFGEGVMTREVNLTDHSGKLAEILPGFHDSNYFFQLDKLSGDRNLLSLVRKDLVIKAITQKRFHDICFSGLLIGASPLIPLASNFATQSGKIPVGAYVLEMKDGEILVIEKRESDSHRTSVGFLEEERSDKEVFVLAAGILALTNPEGYCGEEFLWTKGYKESIRALLGRRLIRAALGSLFLLLLINFFLFDYLFEKNGKLENELKTSRGMLSELASLKADLDQKQKFIDDNRLNDFYYLSYYADQVGELAKNDIRLEKMEFNPLKRALKPGKPVELTKGILKLEGIAFNVEAYQRFLSEIEQKSWSLTVVSQDYQYKAQRSFANFRVEVKCDFSVFNEK